MWLCLPKQCCQCCAVLLFPPLPLSLLRALEPAGTQQVIKLNNNKLVKLPDEIGQCASLVRLWLHNNKLASLPRTIGWLYKLEHLSMEKNQITDLPVEFGRLTSLTALSYDEDKVPGTELDLLGALVGLEREQRWKRIQGYLRMMDCAHLDKTLVFPAEKTATPFTQYPNFVTRLVDLRRVCLRDHKLPDLPLGVLSLFSSVTSLDLANNLIKTVRNRPPPLPIKFSLPTSSGLPIPLSAHSPLYPSPFFVPTPSTVPEEGRHATCHVVAAPPQLMGRVHAMRRDTMICA